MELQLTKYYNNYKKLKWFYLDRFIRIWPLYLVYMFITLLVNYIWPINSSFLSNPSIGNLFKNILILPLGYYMYNGVDSFTIIPPAWCLGLELTFYIIFPIIYFLKSKRIFLVLSLIIFGFAYIGIINTDLFGYRLIPGTLFIFIIGTLLAEPKSKRNKYVILSICIICIILLINTYIKPLLNVPYNREVLYGITIGVPLINLLKKIKGSLIDKYLGKISYGIFLNHFLIIFIIQKLVGERAFLIKYQVLLIVTSFLLSTLSYFVIEYPIDKLRKRLTKI